MTKSNITVPGLAKEGQRSVHVGGCLVRRVQMSGCAVLLYLCISYSAVFSAWQIGNTARRSSGAFRLLRRKVRHFAAECVLPWFAGEFAKRARLHTRTRLRILPAGFARFLGKRKFLSPDDDRCFNARMEGCERVLARLSMLLR